MTDQPHGPGTPEEPGAAAAPGAGGSDAPADTAAAAAANAEPVESAESAESAEEAPAAPVGWLPEPADRIFGAGATAEEAYDLLTVDVPAAAWLDALTAARDALGCTYFDWLSAVDEPGTGFRVCAHLADVGRAGNVRRLVVRTTVPHAEAALPTAVGVYAGAAWHERETHEMFGVDFTGHPDLAPLLLPDGFEGHPLRKDFVLAARVAKAWPGAKEPGESEHGGPKRRQMLPPGVPDPNDWGPMKGQLPPAPARPARGARAAGARAAGGAAGRAAAGERPARRTRSVSAGSASQQAAAATEKPEEKGVEPPKGPAEAAGAADAAAAAGTPAEAERPTRPEGARPARRTRSASEGSVSQQVERDAGSDQEAGGARGAGSAAQDAAAGAAPSTPRTAPRSSDAPWHHARPTFDDEAGRGADAAEQAAQGTTDDTGRTEKPAPEEQPSRTENQAPEEQNTTDETEGGTS